MPLLVNKGLYLVQVGLKPIRCQLFFTKCVDGIAEVFPLSCSCIGWAEQGLLKHSDEFLHFLWFAGDSCVDTMSAFFLGMMHPLGLKFTLQQTREWSVSQSALW